MNAHLEQNLLDAFWARVDDWDRLELLRTVADVRIPRGFGWSQRVVREEGVPLYLHKPSLCFGCLRVDKLLSWHHVIQIQHGGSNTSRNCVAICQDCHGAIHPWLKRVPEQKTGFQSIGEVMQVSWHLIEDLFRKQA